MFAAGVNDLGVAFARSHLSSILPSLIYMYVCGMAVSRDLMAVGSNNILHLCIYFCWYHWCLII